MKTAYKIFDLHGNRPKTLFHGIDGSRILTVGQWIKAVKRMVTNGSRQHPYLSGFHSYPTLEDVKLWLRGAQIIEGRVAVKVKVDGCREKPNAIRDTILSDWLLITPKDWGERIPATEFV